MNLILQKCKLSELADAFGCVSLDFTEADDLLYTSEPYCYTVVNGHVRMFQLANVGGKTITHTVIICLDESREEIASCHSTREGSLNVITHETVELPDPLMPIIQHNNVYSNKISIRTCNCHRKKNAGYSISYKLCKLLDRVKVYRKFTVPSPLVNNSSVASELSIKNDHLKTAISVDTKECHCSTNARCYWWLINSFINLLLGMMLLALFSQYASLFSSRLLLHTKWVVMRMIELLEWLMDVPAGLKLNGKLTVFLGRFFMYHIWLWSEYLKLAGAYFDKVLVIIGIAGLPGGISLQLALLQDTMNIYFLHIYCFHIYTDRLYTLVRSSVVSLWRLFRGLKWNTLRERVDHASYDSTQLFIGTLIFSILLFILPTVLLYYVVFGGLRLILLSVHLTLNEARCKISEGKLLTLLRSLNKRYFEAKYRLKFQPPTDESVSAVTILKVD